MLYNKSAFLCLEMKLSMPLFAGISLSVGVHQPTKMMLLGIIFFCFQVCLSTEFPDVTAIYHVGENSSVNYVDIHLRTDALGLPLATKNQLIGPEDAEFYVDAYNLNTWEHENWTIVTEEASPGIFLLSHRVMMKGPGGSQFYHFSGGIHIDMKECDGNISDVVVILIPDGKPLALQPMFYHISIKFCKDFKIYICGNDIDGISFMTSSGHRISCKEETSYYLVYKVNSWSVKQEDDGELKIWIDNVYSEPRMRWNSQFKINIYKIFSSSELNIAIYPLVKVLETTGEARFVSPPFTPKYKNLCIAAIFWAGSFPSLLKSVDVYAQDQDMLLLPEFLGFIEKDLFMEKPGCHIKKLIVRWPNTINSTRVRLVIKTLVTGGSLRIGRISSCNGEDGEDVVLLRDKEIVPFSDIVIPSLGHKVDDNVASISLPPCHAGFVGSTCAKGCGRNRYGKDCKGKCSVHQSECSGLLLCVPVTGCSCAPGYTGQTCEDKCENNTYGNNCTQICGHCKEGTCNIYTGKCPACLPGYQLPFCKKKYDYTLVAPDVNTETLGEAIVTPLIKERTHNANPLFYTIQFKKQFALDQWNSYNTYLMPSEGLAEEIIMKGLEHGTQYIVRTVLIDADLNSYQGEDIPVANFTSLCIIPENPEFQVEIVTSETSFTASWKYTLGNIYLCPVEKFEVTWKGGWKWITDFTDETTYTVSNLLPGTSIKFKVRAITNHGSSLFSPVTKFSTKSNNVSEPVQDLSIVTTSSRNARIKWRPPLGLENTSLVYTVTYKCLVQVACQKQCVESLGELHTTNTSISLEFLYPLSQYSVTVSAENGPVDSIIIGTNMTVPDEVPKPSSKSAIRTNTSITVFWNKPDVCSGFFKNYMYLIYKVSNTQLLRTGSTLNTSMTFDNLQVSTDYRVLVHIQTTFDVNYDTYLEINVSTSASVPDKVQNLTVYKRGRHLLGLRWAPPVNSYGPVISFAVKYSHGENTPSKTVNIKPNPCMVWPHLFCHTIAHLEADRMYTISVSARNSEIDEDGTPVEVKGITKEKTPGPPENVKLVNSTSTSFSVQWDYPWLANGIIRSFPINIEQTEQFEGEQCCQQFPLSETTITEELEHYLTEVSGLHPASTYVVSISAKTVALGPSQTITVHTRPPPLPIVQLPKVVTQTDDTVVWLPQDPNVVNNSDVYKPLIKGMLILIISNDTEFNTTGIQNEKLNEDLKTVIARNFCFAAEYMGHETELLLGTDEITNSKWGKIHNTMLQENIAYQLAAVQISEYCGVYNLDVVWSLPFQAS